MIHPHFKFLGRKVRDVVTEIEGVCDSICFDLYGCIVASVRPNGVTDKHEPKVAHWFDAKRLIVLNDTPVMTLPDFSQPEIGSASKLTR